MDPELEEEQLSTYNEISRDDMQKDLLTAFHSICDKLEGLWEEIGFPMRSRYKRSHLVLYHLKVLMNGLVEEEESLLKRLLDGLEKYSAEVMALSDELSVPPFEPEEGTSLIELEKILRSKADELTKEKFQRMKTLLELKEREKNICMTLDMPPYSLSSTDVPSCEQLVELNQHLAMLTDEKERRIRKFQALKASIKEAMDNLGHTPQTALEKEVVYAREDDVLLSDKNMIDIKSLCGHLEDCCKTNEKRAEELRRKLSNLWHCLKVDPVERESILLDHAGYKLSTIEVLQRELQRYEELKKENMKSFVENCREQLKELWEKCYASEEQISRFTAFFDDNYTDELLSQHEAEINQWQDYWRRFQELFLGIEKLRLLWNQVKLFEKKASDPNRFANRGGALLLEEKERKKLIKSLPEVEEQLKALALEWESQEGQVFLVHGMRLPDYLTQCRDEHDREKENEKNLRKKKQEEENRAYVSFANKRVRTPGTPLLQMSNVKRTKYTSTSRPQTPVGTVFRTPATTHRKSPRLNKRTPKESTPRNPFRPIHNENSEAPVVDVNDCSSIAPSFISIASYTDFKHDLNQTIRGNSRSTLLNLNTPTKRFVCGRNPTPQRNRTMMRRRSQRKRGNLSRTRIAAPTSSSSKAKSPLKLNVPLRNKLGLPLLI